MRHESEELISLCRKCMTKKELPFVKICSPFHYNTMQDYHLSGCGIVLFPLPKE